jgi:hypothetical protein
MPQHEACEHNTGDKMYGKICNDCNEGFNLSYFRQLVAEYNLLADAEKEIRPNAKTIIERIIKKVDGGKAHATCDDIFEMEKALIQLQTLEKIQLERDNLRSKYKKITEKDRYAEYLQRAIDHEKGANNTTPLRDIILSDVDYLFSEVHLHYTLMPFREQQRSEILKEIGGIILGFFVFFLVFITSTKHFTGLILMCLISLVGALGAFVSVARRLNDVPPLVDPMVSFFSLKYGRMSIYMAPVSGIIFANLLFVLCGSGLVAGDIFPKLLAPKPDLESFLTAAVPKADIVEYAKLFVWSFIAGFAERFVPDTLDRLVARQAQPISAPQNTA